MIQKNQLSKFGIGTWGIGGFAESDLNNNDSEQIDALAYMISKGMNLIEVNKWYAEGHSVALVQKGLKESGMHRENIFLHQAIYHFNNPILKKAEKEVYEMMDLFQTDYIDSLEFTLLAFPAYGFEKIVEFIKKLLEKNIIRYTSITNSNLEYLKRYYEVFKGKLFAHEIGFNFEIRENEDLKITTFADRHNIMNIIYQPLRRNRTANRKWELLIELSKKYGKTQNQIILNWLNSKGFLPMFKSESSKHIDENLDSLSFEIEKSDLDKINSFRPKGWKRPKIDWFGVGEGIRIDQLSNVFDEVYTKED